MSQYFINDHRVFDAGDDMHGRTNAAGAWMRESGHFGRSIAAFTAYLDVDIEHPLEAAAPRS